MKLDTDEIIQLVKNSMKVTTISCEDLSHEHQKHPEAKRSGGGHYRLVIVSPVFHGLSLLERQRKVMSLFEDSFRENKIHALSLELSCPK